MTSVDAPAGAPVRDLDHLPFVARFTQLPGDPDEALDGASTRPRQVRGAAFSRVRPTGVAAPRTLAWSPEVAELLGIPEDVCRSQDFAEVFSGNRVPAGADPHAARYGGHQFGSWAGQLGDGRAISLGEVRDRLGGLQTLQLKGAGRTPYSRGADGRAVLRSSVREFLCSEAMAHLGIPTTRALSLVATGDAVVRDVLYDGHPAAEPGAVVCRVAPHFLRFGSYQLAAAAKELDLLRALVDLAVDSDVPELRAQDLGPDELVAAWFAEVARRSALLVAGWMRVGFVHGVLNTDNLSVAGLTIDYGPYGWLEGFDPEWTPNTTDAGTRRYRYGAQPHVVQWNLQQLGNALAHVVGDTAGLQAGLDAYARTYSDAFTSALTDRLGWGTPQDDDGPVLDELFTTLVRTETDQVRFFRDLAAVPVAEDATDDELLAPLQQAFYRPDEVVGDVRAALVAWLRAWGRRAAPERSGLDAATRRARMDAANPRFVLRNWMAQEAIDAAEAGDPSVVLELLDVLRHPYDEQPGRERWAERRPEWARHRVGCSMLSCSS